MLDSGVTKSKFHQQAEQFQPEIEGWIWDSGNEETF